MEGAAVNQEFSLLVCDFSVIQKPRNLLYNQGKLLGVERVKTENRDRI